MEEGTWISISTAGGCQWGLKRMEEVQRNLEGEQFEVPKVSFWFT